MITSTQVYWLMVLDGIKSYIGGVAWLLGVVAVVAMIAGALFTALAIDEDRPPKKWWVFTPIGIFIFALLLGLLGALTPTTKQMAVIAVAPEMLNNEQVRELPNNVVTLANDWLEELRPKGATSDISSN